MPLVTTKRLGNRMQEREIFDRDAIDVEFLVFENRLVHRVAIEYEYEYRPAD